MLVLATDKGFPGHLTGEHLEVVNYVVPCMWVVVLVAIAFAIYSFRQPLRVPVANLVDRKKAWALFLKFDRRGEQRIDFEDMTVWMGIVCTDGKQMEQWNVGLYQNLCSQLGVHPSEGFSFPQFLAIYSLQFGNCEEHYNKVFKAERTELAHSLLNEDPVENISAVQFAEIDTRMTGKCNAEQFETCFKSCCAEIGIENPKDHWFPLAFASFDTDNDKLLSYDEFHQTVQQYRDHVKNAA